MASLIQFTTLSAIMGFLFAFSLKTETDCNNCRLSVAFSAILCNTAIIGIIANITLYLEKQMNPDSVNESVEQLIKSPDSEAVN